MLQFVFILLVIINALLFLFLSKKISYLFVYYMSSCVYYSSAFWGYYHSNISGFSSGVFDDTMIDAKTYWLMIVNMLCIMFVLIVGAIRKKIGSCQNDCNSNNDNSGGDGGGVNYRNSGFVSERYAVRVAIAFSFIVAIFCVLPPVISSFGGSFNKAELLEDAPGIVNYFKCIVTFLTIYLFTQKRVNYSKMDYIAVLFLMFLTLLLGHRSYVVIAIIGILITRINTSSKGKNLLALFVKNWKKILLIVLCFFVFMFSKNIYTALFNGNIDLVKNRLSDSSYYQNSIKVSEFNTIFANLDSVVSRDYTFPIDIYLKRTLFTALPVVNKYIEEEPFSRKYQMDLFGVNTRASTFIGEAYACGGFLLSVIIILLVIIIVLLLAFGARNAKSNIWRTFFILSSVDVAFYIHRNSLEYGLYRVRSYLLIAIFVYAIYLFLERMKKNEK